MPEHPTSRCGHCGEEDDHPKHQVLVGFNNAHTSGAMFHDHDYARDGMVFYHFHCPSPWHAEAAAINPDHGRIVALAQSGVRGDELRSRIQAGDL